MTVKEYIQTATDSEIAQYITGMIVASVEATTDTRVEFEKTIAFYAATLKLLDEEISESELKSNRSKSMFLALTLNNMTTLMGDIDDE